LFGRVTYDMMASYWPTPAAMKNAPDVARHINDLQKYVASRTLKEASWKNTTVLGGDLVSEVRALKKASGSDITILGSGSIVSQLMEAALIDELQIVVNPIVLGRGRTLFETVKKSVPLKRVDTRVFGNGNVVLSYRAS